MSMSKRLQYFQDNFADEDADEFDPSQYYYKRDAPNASTSTAGASGLVGTSADQAAVSGAAGATNPTLASLLAAAAAAQHGGHHPGAGSGYAAVAGRQQPTGGANPMSAFGSSFAGAPHPHHPHAHHHHDSSLSSFGYLNSQDSISSGGAAGMNGSAAAAAAAAAAGLLDPNGAPSMASALRAMSSQPTSATGAGPAQAFQFSQPSAASSATNSVQSSPRPSSQQSGQLSQQQQMQSQQNSSQQSQRPPSPTTPSRSQNAAGMNAAMMRSPMVGGGAGASQFSMQQEYLPSDTILAMLNGGMMAPSGMPGAAMTPGSAGSNAFLQKVPPGAGLPPGMDAATAMMFRGQQLQSFQQQSFMNSAVAAQQQAAAAAAAQSQQQQQQQAIRAKRRIMLDDATGQQGGLAGGALGNLGSIPSNGTNQNPAAAAAAAQASIDGRYGLLGLMPVIKMMDEDVNVLALGYDLTTLGLNLNSADYLHNSFSSPWVDAPPRIQPAYFKVPDCYLSQPHPKDASYVQKFSKFSEETLFYIFYTMPKDISQIIAAKQLSSKGWRYHKEMKMWFKQAPGTQLLQKTPAYEQGSYIYFDINTWRLERKDNIQLSLEFVDSY